MASQVKACTSCFKDTLALADGVGAPEGKMDVCGHGVEAREGVPHAEISASVGWEYRRWWDQGRGEGQTVRDETEEMDRNWGLENTGYHNEEIRTHPQGGCGPWPKGNQGEFSEKSGFEGVSCSWLSFLFLSKKFLAWFSLVSVFRGNDTCVSSIQMFGVLSWWVRKDLRSCRQR